MDVRLCFVLGCVFLLRDSMIRKCFAFPRCVVARGRRNGHGEKPGYDAISFWREVLIDDSG